MKGDITIRPEKDRDAKLEKIAAWHKTTVNQIISMCALEISRVPAAQLYQALAAIGERVDDLRKRRSPKPEDTGIHQRTTEEHR